MGSEEDDDAPLTYLPMIIPVLLLEALVLNCFIYYDWKRRLMSSGDSNVPLFSRPERLSWLTECPWDKLSGISVGVDSFSISKSLWGGSWDIVLFAFRVLSVATFFIVGVLINFSGDSTAINLTFFTNWNLCFISFFYLLVTYWSFMETGTYSIIHMLLKSWI
jgi:hypothetical protein